ncbi:hypothetical protein BGZ75_003835 [Mortierella antarctica]|nr:hypothetical protein BGZ75_003835 [Mortierella antarctica]
MLPSTISRAAVQARVPLIKFLGPRSALNEAPKDAEYPLKAVAPVKASSSSSPSKASAAPGGASRHHLDFTELPARYRHPQLTQAEIEAVEAGGATLIY